MWVHRLGVLRRAWQGSFSEFTNSLGDLNFTEHNWDGKDGVWSPPFLPSPTTNLTLQNTPSKRADAWNRNLQSIRWSWVLNSTNQKQLCPDIITPAGLIRTEAKPKDVFLGQREQFQFTQTKRGKIKVEHPCSGNTAGANLKFLSNLTWMTSILLYGQRLKAFRVLDRSGKWHDLHMISCQLVDEFRRPAGAWYPSMKVVSWFHTKISRWTS